MLANHSLAGWMCYAMCLSALAGMVAAGAEAIVQRTGRSVAPLWGASLGAAILLPLLAWGVLRPAAVPTVVTRTGPAPEAATPATGETTPSRRDAAATLPSARATPAAWAWSLPAIHLPTLGRFDAAARLVAWGSSAIYGLWILVAWLSLRARRREWREGAVDGVPVLLSQDFGPAIVGTRHPRIVFPTWALELPANEQRLMLTHEHAHLAAHDERGRTAALSGLAIMPWNLPLWYHLRRYRLAVELDCDARVVREARQVRPYANLLLEVARRTSGGSAIVAALVDRPSALRRRIEAMTTRDVQPPIRRVARGAAIVVLAVAMACVIAPPTPPVPIATVDYVTHTTIEPEHAPGAPTAPSPIATISSTIHDVTITTIQPENAPVATQSVASLDSGPKTHPASEDVGIPVSLVPPAVPNAHAIIPAAVASPAIAEPSVGARHIQGNDADIIRGEVTGPDGLPIGGVLVAATSRVDGATDRTHTNANGRYSLNAEGGTGDYLLAFTAAGYETRTIPVRRVRDAAILLADARLRASTGNTIGMSNTECPRPVEVFIPPRPVMDSVRGRVVAVELFITPTGTVDSLRFAPTRDPAYNLSLNAALRATRYTPPVGPNGSPAARWCGLNFQY